MKMGLGVILMIASVVLVLSGFLMMNTVGAVIILGGLIAFRFGIALQTGSNGKMKGVG